jgi:hypothetical protein
VQEPHEPAAATAQQAVEARPGQREVTPERSRRLAHQHRAGLFPAQQVDVDQEGVRRDDLAEPGHALPAPPPRGARALREWARDWIV